MKPIQTYSADKALALREGAVTLVGVESSEYEQIYYRPEQGVVVRISTIQTVDKEGEEINTQIVGSLLLLSDYITSLYRPEYSSSFLQDTADF